jgi:hypothetical protein
MSLMSLYVQFSEWLASLRLRFASCCLGANHLLEDGCPCTAARYAHDAAAWVLSIH